MLNSLTVVIRVFREEPASEQVEEEDYDYTERAQGDVRREDGEDKYGN